MEKASTQPFAPIRGQTCRRRFSQARRPSAPEWADAETRAFLERPQCGQFSAKLLQAILLAAMAVALAKAAWILVSQA